MPAVFASGQTYKGSFRADTMKLVVGGQSADGLLFQSMNYQFSQQITTLYEIGSNNVYLVGGRAQGTAGISHVAGPGQFTTQLIRQYNDICNPQDIAFAAQSGCANVAGELEVLLKQAVLQSVSGAVNAQDVVINKQLQFMFIDLQYE